MNTKRVKNSFTRIKTTQTGVRVGYATESSGLIRLDRESTVIQMAHERGYGHLGRGP